MLTESTFMYSILVSSCLYLVLEDFDNILYHKLLIVNAKGLAQIRLRYVHTGITTQFISFKMVEGVMNWFCTGGSKTPMAFSASLEHFSNFARKFNLLSIVIPSAVDSVANFIVFPCNTIFSVDSRISSRILEKMTTYDFGHKISRRYFPTHFVIFSQAFWGWGMRKSFFHRVACWNMCGVIVVLFSFTFGIILQCSR